ncbi:MAG TPA: tRNA (N(6)-L-threonylcarbamoyladenosine(37)-C(2))-methylthiotransferase MtaB [Terriglobales bacterium]|nr:tRNA (N(6)-L-threonylcarbamoyladenosine(37)-C(2))-methylthiotransferase MtaB [Terriglobales bacterium]
MARVFLHSFGCRANQAEGAALAAALQRAGLESAAAPAGADWVVLHTCTVTAAADAEARRAIRRLHRLHPHARIAVTGCYAQRAPAELAALPGVALVAGRAQQPALAHALLPLAALAAAPLPPAPLPPALLPARVRPVVQVQEGCDRRCAYCIVPQVRGASRSLPLGAVLGEIQGLADQGAQEVVVSGINLGQWGRDLDAGLRLASLLRAILDQTSLARLRLSSVEPMDWEPSLTALLAAEPRLCRHVHLPLQSGSPAVLRRMRRRYRPADFARLVLELRRQVPAAALGTDVIVGFPGETDADFEQTRALLADLPLTYLHVFPFSPRPGTEAAERLAGGQWTAVPPARAAQRAAALRQLGERKLAAFQAAMVGARLAVVALHDLHPEGRWSLSDNYLRVALPASVPANQHLTVEITGAAGPHLKGQPVAA